MITLDPKELKTDTLRVKLNEEEKNLLVAASKATGFKISTWVRAVALEKAKLLLGALNAPEKK